MEKADEYTLRMSVTEGEKQYIETGDRVTVQIDDRKVNTEVSALYKNGANDQCYVVEAVISGDVFNVGDSVLTDISHQSDKYDSWCLCQPYMRTPLVPMCWWSGPRRLFSEQRLWQQRYM